MDHNYATRISHLLLLFFTLLLSQSLCSSGLCNPYDKSVLLRIKAQQGNPASLQSWNSNTDCCNDYWGTPNTYIEINCDDHGHVTGLYIDYASDLKGEILLPALGDLTYLQTLKLTYVFNQSTTIPLAMCTKFPNLWSLIIIESKLTGPIPDCLGQLKNLVEIDLSMNSLTGPVPIGLGQLSKLQTLALNSNNLSGKMPEFPTTMSAFYWITVATNNISGPIPASLGLLPNLQTLILGGNKFNGLIPESLGHITKLRWLDLSSNQLTGPIPDSLGLLPNNVGIVLSNNQLTGPIPKSMGRISPWWLDLSGNDFTGDASFFFARNKSSLERIDLSRNCFKFNFSSVVDFPQQLRFMNVSHNKIYGSLPKQLGDLPYLWSIDVSYNKLCGPIPTGPASGRFSPSNFAENKCLCGPPLAPCK